MVAKQVSLYLAPSDLERIRKLKPFASENRASAVFREAIREAEEDGAIVLCGHLERSTPIRSSVILSAEDYATVRSVMERSSCTSMSETIRAAVLWLYRRRANRKMMQSG